MYTTHGHHISGTVDYHKDRPKSVARCGGPGLCSLCSVEATQAHVIMKIKEKAVSNDEGYMDKAKRLVVAHANKRMEKTDNVVLTEDMVYVVWFSKTLQNWKALLSTTLSDGMYYEVTYNGDKAETYVDSYKKWENSAYPDEVETEADTK